jgi:hypothetical protein
MGLSVSRIVYLRLAYGFVEESGGALYGEVHG